MNAALITRSVKILIGFVLLWGGLWVFNTMGCTRTEGGEMMPTLPGEKTLLIDPRISRAEQLKHDDIVLYTCELPGSRGGARKVAARVVGLPGDRVKIVKGEVFVDGQRAATSVAPDKKAPDDYAEIFVPRDSVFVLCDSRSGFKNLDSRTLGPIGCWAIVGKVR